MLDTPPKYLRPTLCACILRSEKALYYYIEDWLAANLFTYWSSCDFTRCKPARDFLLSHSAEWQWAVGWLRKKVSNGLVLWSETDYVISLLTAVIWLLQVVTVQFLIQWDFPLQVIPENCQCTGDLLFLFIIPGLKSIPRFLDRTLWKRPMLCWMNWRQETHTRHLRSQALVEGGAPHLLIKPSTILMNIPV